MKKQLPHIYKGNVKNDNNLRVAHGIKEEINHNPRETINNLFKQNKLYKQDVEIKTNQDRYVTKIIGRTNEHIITIKNEVIKIDDIITLKILK